MSWSYLNYGNTEQPKTNSASSGGTAGTVSSLASSMAQLYAAWREMNQPPQGATPQRTQMDIQPTASQWLRK